MKLKMATNEDKTPHNTVDDKDEIEEEDLGDNEGSEPPSKKAKLKGRNKQRPRNERIDAKDKMCPAIKENRECRFGDNCKFNHDKKDFMSKKLPELEGSCYVFDKFGFCQYGITCRYASNHLADNLQNIVKDDVFEKMKGKKKFLNELGGEIRQKLWKKKYNFKRADAVVKDVQKNFRGWGDQGAGDDKSEKINSFSISSDSNKTISANDETNSNKEVESIMSQKEDQPNPDKIKTNALPAGAGSGPQTGKSEETSKRYLGCITDEEVVRIRPEESKKVDMFFHLIILSNDKLTPYNYSWVAGK